jgi:Flp pilus assembly protein TadD
LLLATARFDESIAEAMRALELDPLSPQIVGNLAFAYLVMRRYGLGDKDEAFRLLEKAYEDSSSMPNLAADPFWYGIRSDPRYSDLLRRMGLPQPM